MDIEFCGHIRLGGVQKPAEFLTTMATMQLADACPLLLCGICHAERGHPRSADSVGNLRSGTARTPDRRQRLRFGPSGPRSSRDGSRDDSPAPKKLQEPHARWTSTASPSPSLKDRTPLRLATELPSPHGTLGTLLGKLRRQDPSCLRRDASEAFMRCALVELVQL
jgi:hypothetical protein